MMRNRELKLLEMRRESRSGGRGGGGRGAEREVKRIKM